MQAVRRILCPTDFSEASAPAFDYAEQLAATTEAELVVLHVVSVPDAWGSGGLADALNQDLKQRLVSLVPRNPDVPVTHVCHGGPAGEVICWIAQERECDLVVMGTHGRTGVRHLVLGSVAEHVVRHAPCPVLTVRQRPADEKRLIEPSVDVPMPPIV